MKRAKQKLNGIDEIAGYADTGIFNVMSWHKDYGFPMKRDVSGVIWLSTKREIDGWMNDNSDMVEG